MPLELDALRQTARRAQQRLLRLRTPQGHWEGELSSSALSTATALFALHLRDPERYRPLVLGGREWLVRHQNADGGWGDTGLSGSNLSTTALCWSALAAEPVSDESAAASARAGAWIRQAAGSLEPAVLAPAIAARYGRDRTFSVPIITMCALSGRLGADRAAWGHIPGLPFELALCPREWFRWLRLPVVSYALPALIAMGQVGHHHRPSANPGLRLLRQAARGRTLEVLRALQPAGGGFLEATPLTSFVVMSLVGCGLADHPVAAEGAAFLAASVRPDGSWPIDTNLATWITTLAVNAWEPGEGGLSFAELDRHRILDWLLAQQYRAVHPYTGAAPGGWAWTDLPGGVPDADDTAGALLALRRLGPDDIRCRQAAAEGVRWLLDLQNQDGGLPTFCRGWGALPFDRSGPDLTAHALRAWQAWRDQLPSPLPGRIDTATGAAVGYLSRTQRADGAWVPLWFGCESAADEVNPVYGTARVLPALRALASGGVAAAEGPRSRGRDWLLAAQNDDGGWGGDRGSPSTLEETGLALTALAPEAPEAGGTLIPGAVRRGAAWIVERAEEGQEFPPAPIGFYFARLWYFEREYPLIFALAGLGHAARLLDTGEDLSPPRFG